MVYSLIASILEANSVFQRIFTIALGYTLIPSFTFLVGFILYSWIYEVVPVIFFKTNNIWFAGALLITGLYIGFNIIFNYFMAVFTNPGEIPKDFKGYGVVMKEKEGVVLGNEDDGESTPFSSQNENTAEEEEPRRRAVDLEDGEAGRLSSSSHEFEVQFCKKCNCLKPLRSHHCKICDRCVLKMDHHCPWINTCVGHHNHRYFLLMIYYLMAGVTVFAVFGSPMMILAEFQDFRINAKAFQINCAICIVFTVVMAGFNGWNWYLACTGQTAIEFAGMKHHKPYRSIDQKTGEEVPPQYYDFRRPSSGANLEIIFGTNSFCNALLPSFKPIKHDGVNWQEFCVLKRNDQNNNS